MKKLKPKALLKVPLQIDFETGRVEKTIEEILEFKKGTILKLEESKKNVIQMYVNGKLYGHGEATDKNGMMAVKINDLLDK